MNEAAMRAQAEADLLSRGIRCFLLTPAGHTRRSLRRFVWSNEAKCPGPLGFHDASHLLDFVEGDPPPIDDWPHDDPRWPKRCACGFEFRETDQWQLFCNRLYLRGGTDDMVALRDAPAGAMWYADWNTVDVGPDGRCLMVKLPGNRDWIVDSEANNCTRKGDRSHRCWVRHGEPPDVTVDKNGNTCSAGAGSSLVPGWHGFLRNGVLVPC